MKTIKGSTLLLAIAGLLSLASCYEKRVVVENHPRPRPRAEVIVVEHPRHHGHYHHER